MKLTFQDVAVERSSVFKNQQFDIGNKRIILEILRGKMYSNPIQTVCQEIMSNARDAHLEVGKGHLPITVKLPNKLDPEFYIKDCGPGITPERMADVFIKYGSSTKREDNIQSGSFGLGAKSPFSYADTFTIISVTPFDGKMIKRQYLAHIDESGLGEMSCVQEIETDEPQGTTISVTSKPNDFASFRTYTLQTGAHWDPKPIILGDPDWEWPAYKVSLKGTDWEIHENSHAGSSPLALIHGIPYRINLNHLYPQGLPVDLRNISMVPLRLLLKIGEVPVTANREDLDYQPHVIKYLQEKITTAISELKDLLTIELKNKTNLYDAIVLLEQLRRKPFGVFLTNVQWRDLELHRYERIETTREKVIVSTYRRDNQVRAGCKKINGGRYRSGRNEPIQVKGDTLLVEDDTKKKVTSYARLATLFDNNPNCKYAVVLNFSLTEKTFTDPTSQQTIYDLVLSTDKEITDKKAEADRNFKWSLFNPLQLSTIPKKRIPNGTVTPSVRKPTQKIKKLNIDSMEWVPATANDHQSLKQCYYVVTSGTTIYLDHAADKRISLKDLVETIKRVDKLGCGINVVFGCVPTHVSDLEPKWKPLLPYLKESYAKSSLVIAANAESPYCAQNLIPISKMIMVEEFIKKLDPSSLLRNYLEGSKRITDSKIMLDTVNSLGATLNFPMIARKQNDQLKDQYEKVSETYSLLLSLQAYRISSKALDDLAIYVNMKDVNMKDNQPPLSTKMDGGL